MDITWAIEKHQSYIGLNSNFPKMLSAVQSLGLPVIDVEIVPFSTQPLDVPKDRPVVFYGSTTLRDRVIAERGWTPGVFYDPERFSFQALREHYGEQLLNYDSEIVSVGEFSEEPSDEIVFVRPTLDAKFITGGIGTRLEWAENLAIYRNRVNGPKDSTLIQVSSPKEILKEWRMFIVDGLVISSSSYRIGDRMNPSYPVPRKVIDMGLSLAADYSPAPVFALDLCETPDGLKVVETNTMNCSGLYQCDELSLVLAINRFIKRTYQ